MAKIKKAGKGFKVVHETTGKTLARSKTLSGARKKAAQIRKKNR